MNARLGKFIYSAFLLTLICTTSVRGAERSQWLSVTLDNDLFLGDDSGYTNGIFFSGFNAYEGNSQRQGRWLLKPLRWTMPSVALAKQQVLGFSVGQKLHTPNDISLLDPPRDEPPYGGLLFYAQSYVQVADSHADQITTSVGVVGPIALGDPAQTFVHSITGSEPPEGWDTQINNEVVFNFSRGRLWRNWVSGSGRADFLTVVTADIGTIQTGVRSDIYWRYGRGLKSSFASPLLNTGRATNPIATDGGWFVYGGLSVGTQFRYVLLDGNTFRDSRSVEYKDEFLGYTVGASYAWSNSTLTLAISDTSVYQNLTNDAWDQVTQFGSLTYAWQLDPAKAKRGWLFETPREQDNRRR